MLLLSSHWRSTVVYFVDWFLNSTVDLHFDLIDSRFPIKFIFNKLICFEETLQLSWQFEVLIRYDVHVSCHFGNCLLIVLIAAH